MSWKITSAPWMESSLMTLSTAFSFPGMGWELMMITSLGVMVTLRWIPLAIRDRAAMLSPWEPVVISTVFSGG